MLFAQFAPLWNFFTAALFGHRAARMNFQPDGGLAGLGISPSSFWAFLLLSGSRGGIAESSALVYGWLGLSKDFRVGEDSTSVPRDITATRSATWAITPRSWVMKRIAIPNSATRSFIRSSTCAWIATSSAVVGSSAISNLGNYSKFYIFSVSMSNKILLDKSFFILHFILGASKESEVYLTKLSSFH